MRIACFILSFILVVPLYVTATSVDVGISFDDEGVRGFYFAVGDYYRVPEKEVLIVKERHISTEEIPVVFFIAEKAHVKTSSIIDLRLKGKSWMDILVYFGLNPEILYVPVQETVVIGPPYGKAYGYYKKKPRKEWKSIVLNDADIVNFVNLRFLSEYYNYTPEKVIKLREGGKNFIVIHDEFIKEKKKAKVTKEKKEVTKEKGTSEKQKGKGKKN